MNLPNAITTARIAVMPLVAVLPFLESWEWRLVAVVLYIAAAVTGVRDAASPDLEWTLPGAGLVLAGIGYAVLTVLAWRLRRPAALG